MGTDGKKPLGIYVHIPFCVRKCKYCDFVSFPVGEPGESGESAYVDAVIKEIRGYRDKFGCADTEYEVKTVYIGGGTPSVIAPFYIVRILDSIRETFLLGKDAEITIEVNPGTVDPDKLKTYRDAGINRISIGLQSVSDTELKALGRIHDFNDFMKAYKDAAAAGFGNINVDVMTAIPYQTMDSLRVTLDTVTGLSPKPVHISAYSLIIEEGTPFYDIYGGGENHEGPALHRDMFSQCAQLPDEETERAMYHFTADYLKEHGYERYEISNFAIPGYESRHNSAYWRRRDYTGFGLAASSLVNGKRYKNTLKMEDYIKEPLSRELFEESIELTQDDEMSEYMFLGLRMSEGVRADDFKREFGTGLMNWYGDEIKCLMKEGLLARDDAKDRYYLTDKGVDYGNYVFSRFV